RQWPLYNAGFNVDGLPCTAGADIKAEDAWSITTGNPDLIVAVADTGIDISHPDLASNIYANPGAVHPGYPNDIHGYNVAENNNDVTDVLGHGTQMAGLIAAAMNNGTGISGVCQSKILPVKCFRPSDSDPTIPVGTAADGARGILYAIAAG